MSMFEEFRGHVSLRDGKVCGHDGTLNGPIVSINRDGNYSNQTYIFNFTSPPDADRLLEFERKRGMFYFGTKVWDGYVWLEAPFGFRFHFLDDHDQEQENFISWTRGTSMYAIFNLQSKSLSMVTCNDLSVLVNSTGIKFNQKHNHNCIMNVMNAIPRRYFSKFKFSLEFDCDDCVTGRSPSYCIDISRGIKVPRLQLTKFNLSSVDINFSDRSRLDDRDNDHYVHVDETLLDNNQREDDCPSAAEIMSQGADNNNVLKVNISSCNSNGVQTNSSIFGQNNYDYGFQDLVSQMQRLHDKIQSLEKAAEDTPSIFEIIANTYARAIGMENIIWFGYWDTNQTLDWIFSLDNGYFEQFEPQLSSTLIKWRVNGSDVQHFTTAQWGLAGVDYHGARLLSQHIGSMDVWLKAVPILSISFLGLILFCTYLICAGSSRRVDRN